MSAYVFTGTPCRKDCPAARARSARPARRRGSSDRVIVLEQALGNAEPWSEPGFLDAIVGLQLRREPVDGFADRSPVCTLALCRFLGYAPSSLLMSAAERAPATYSRTVVFVRNRGVVEPTPARRITFAQSLEFERVHEETYREHGSELVDVPDGTVAERVAQVEAELD